MTTAWYYRIIEPYLQTVFVYRFSYNIKYIPGDLQIEILVLIRQVGLYMLYIQLVLRPVRGMGIVITGTMTYILVAPARD